MYILSTNGGACMVDAVCQISSGDNPLISVSVMKKNYTNEMMHKNNTFSLSIFGMKDDPRLIKHFGMQSMRDANKFINEEYEIINETPVLKGTLGYLVLEKVDTIETDTHTLFIGKLIEAETNSNEEPMSYNHYQAHKEELMKATSESNKTAWVCTVCGYVYYADELPSDFVCPRCGATREMFIKKE